MNWKDRFFQLHDDIKKQNDKIKEAELSAITARNQVLTGMPRGGNTDTALDRYLLKKERLEQKRELLQRELDELWYEFLEILNYNNITPEATHLFKMRFHKGWSWRKCAAVRKWNEGKCFRVYRAVLCIIDKKIC